LRPTATRRHESVATAIMGRLFQLAVTQI
jgi:hypothetical protein